MHVVSGQAVTAERRASVFALRCAAAQNATVRTETHLGVSRIGVGVLSRMARRELALLDEPAELAPVDAIRERTRHGPTQARGHAPREPGHADLIEGRQGQGRAHLLPTNVARSNVPLSRGWGVQLLF
jgi:hypothetical protein